MFGQQSVDRTIEAVADRLELEDLLSRYSHAVDTRDWDGLASVFVDGAVVDYERNGGPRQTYPEVVEFLRTSMGIFVGYQHYLTNLLVEVAGDEARVRMYAFTQMVTLDDGGESLLSDGGWYDAACVRAEHGWRIRELVAGLVWIDGAWPKGVPRPAWWGKQNDRFSWPGGNA